jgi:HEXXH motif-containing protein
VSASYREAPGLCYVTLHPDLVTMAEALIHETQHGKLNALSFFDPVLENGYSEWSESPVRPDLRPLMGVLLAVHAFVPVAAFHQRLAEIDHPLSRSVETRRRRAAVLDSNARGLETLRDKAKPTSLGARILSELSALQASAQLGA